mmetsp:Transcript_6903/g.13538  ORF Transcript_6903/g.13538 Transcript_6903/m.13538 type:complete len:178 (-) Transcript_6903:121-654(-)
MGNAESRRGRREAKRLKAQMEDIKRRNFLKKLPTLEPYKPNPIIAGMARTGHIGGGGPTLGDIARGIRFQPAHPESFVCRCRVTGTAAPYKWMRTKDYQNWTPDGDLLISVAERIIKEQNIAIENGAQRLEAVYEYLDRDAAYRRAISLNLWTVAMLHADLERALGMSSLVPFTRGA